MGVSSNADAFAGALQRTATAVRVAEKAGVGAAAKVAKASILASARSRGAHAKGSWVSIDDRSARPQALLALRGAKAYWSERGTKAHDVAPKRKRAILTPEGPRAAAHVSGVQAKHFWQPGVQAAAKPAAEANASAIRAALGGGRR